MFGTSDCPSLFGRLNRMGDAGEMMLKWKDRLVSINQAEKMTKEELKDKVVWGEFVSKNDRMEYTDIYKENIRKAKEAAHE